MKTKRLFPNKDPQMALPSQTSRLDRTE